MSMVTQFEKYSVFFFCWREAQLKMVSQRLAVTVMSSSRTQERKKCQLKNGNIEARKRFPSNMNEHEAMEIVKINRIRLPAEKKAKKQLMALIFINVSGIIYSGTRVPCHQRLNNDNNILVLQINVKF